MKRYFMLLIASLTTSVVIISCSSTAGFVSKVRDKLPNREYGFYLKSFDENKADFSYKNDLGSSTDIKIISEKKSSFGEENWVTIFSGKLNSVDLSEFTTLEKKSVIKMLNYMLSSKTSSAETGVEYKFVVDNNFLSLNFTINKEISDLSKSQLVTYLKQIGDLVSYVDAYVEQNNKDKVNNSDYIEGSYNYLNGNFKR
jgi:hypothetical protein